MFQRRFSQKPSPQLITSFKDSFPNLPQLRRDSLLATPLHSDKTPDLDDLMSFDPRNHFGGSEDKREPGSSPHTLGIESPSSQAETNTFNYNSFVEYSTPSAWQHTPPSSTYYPSQYQWSGNLQQDLHAPFSRSLSLPSPGQTHHPAFLSLQDVQLQTPYTGAGFEYPSFHGFSGQHTVPAFNQPFGTPTLPSGPLPSQPYLDATYHDPIGDSRFQVQLLNSTAMVKENEVPVSYLNKRQTYKIAIHDTRPERHNGVATTYRTFVRISFHEEKQRASPDQHWQLWKEGRGMNEAHQHGGKLQAIEHVPQPAAPGQHPNLHLEKDTIDGFCVTWSTAPGHRPYCEVQFRCNFLSTDFSRSKGVKGIPVRLCAKNEVVSFSSAAGPPRTEPEVSYCKIKLFRDHGAERKLTNDEAAIRRAIKKGEDQSKDSPVDDVDDDPVLVGSSGKRRANDHSPVDRRPSKLAKHKRSNSVSSDDSSPVVGDGEVPQKLAALNRLLRSRADITFFSLQGEEADDPDVHPVELTATTGRPSSESSPDVKKIRHTEIGVSGVTDPSSASESKKPTQPVSAPRRQSYLQIPTPLTSENNSMDWQDGIKPEYSADAAVANFQQYASPEDYNKDITHVSLARGRSIQAVDVEPSYQPPPEPSVKPVVSFYVKPVFENSSRAVLHRACYLYERTASAFIGAVARKASISPSDVLSATCIKRSGERELLVGIDDDLIYHIPDGLDLDAELTTIHSTPEADRAGNVYNVFEGPPRYSLTVRGMY